MNDVVTVPAAALEDYVAAIFEAAGCEAVEAARIAFHLMGANLTGHDSHGVIRTPRYVEWLRDGLVLAGQTITVVRETGSHALIDGNSGFGQTIAPLAVDHGIAKARANGLAVVGLRNSGHIGRVGDWAERAADAGLVSIHFVNVAGGLLVAPFGGTERRFGTNPISIGIPGAGRDRLILDLATSIVAEGKVLVAANGGAALPSDALVGPDGRISGDPRQLYGEIEGTQVRNPAAGLGALRAFGEHKGSGLAFMCEMLAACLTGGDTSGPVPGGRRSKITNGMLSIYISPGDFGSAGFEVAAREYAEYVRSTRPISPDAPVLLPGEKEAFTRVRRLAEGVPLQAATWQALVDTGRALSVPAPV
jgi:uncharacterized oxidoreductase